MRPARIAVITSLLAFCTVGVAQVLPEVPDGAQAMSLTGVPRFSPAPAPRLVAQREAARAEYEADPEDADNIIWYGRRLAYTGDYRGAIEMFSEGIEKFPDDPRMYRHRGHRYITIREFDRAIADLEKAASLIEGTENEVEPDGAPNAMNIPVSSLHGNIWYHLGLAYYLKQDWDNAYRAYKAGFDASRNDDNRVSTTHWLYMILRRKGEPEAAEAVLDGISADMEIIENFSYHHLCLFYKGEMTMAELMGESDGSPAGAAVVYGVANWHYVNGRTDVANDMLNGLRETPGWASFGFIAAEADIVSRQ
jgi:hypothetical protein